MSNDPIAVLKGVLHWAELGKKLSGKLSGARLIHESDEQTLDRLIRQAHKTVCGQCRGYGVGTFSDRPCRECHGTGERAYDPNEKPVREVMEA